MNNTKVVFMGTPEFAVPVLDGLIKNYNVVLVVSQADREKDRKGRLLYTPVKKLALDNNIPVYQPDSIRKEYNKVLEYNPDIIDIIDDVYKILIIFNFFWLRNY